jgi:hypothetical protein
MPGKGFANCNNGGESLISKNWRKIKHLVWKILWISMEKSWDVNQT